MMAAQFGDEWGCVLQNYPALYNENVSFIPKTSVQRRFWV